MKFRKKPVTSYRPRDLVRNRENKWLGRVVHVECGVCGVRYRAGNPRCAHTRFPLVSLTIHQLNVAGDYRPCCMPKHFPRVRERR